MAMKDCRECKNYSWCVEWGCLKEGGCEYFEHVYEQYV